MENFDSKALKSGPYSGSSITCPLKLFILEYVLKT